MQWICTAATLRGDRPTNQDQFVVVDGAAAVLDGATSWLHAYNGPDPRDGGWYALARWATDEVDVLVLGDSPVLMRQASGKTELIADERLAATAPAERGAYRDHLRRGHGFDAHFAGLIAAVQRTERRSFNQPDGFWVAEARPEAACHAIRRTFPAEQIVAVTLLSDGAAAAVTDYQLAGWSDLALDGATGWLCRTHAGEESDPDGRRWPRTKRHDDKTVVHIEKLGSDAALA